MSEQQNQPQKEKPTGIVIPPKKPKLSKAERRALQEQQRAAKSAGRGGKPQKKPQQQQQQEKQPAEVEPKRQQAPVEAEDPKQSKRITLLAHLPPYRGTVSYPVRRKHYFLGTPLLTLPSIFHRSTRPPRPVSQRSAGRRQVQGPPSSRLEDGPGLCHHQQSGQSSVSRNAPCLDPSPARLCASRGRRLTPSYKQSTLETKFHVLDDRMSASLRVHGQCLYLRQVSRGGVGS